MPKGCRASRQFARSPARRRGQRSPSRAARVRLRRSGPPQRARAVRRRSAPRQARAPRIGGRPTLPRAGVRRRRVSGRTPDRATEHRRRRTQAALLRQSRPTVRHRQPHLESVRHRAGARPNATPTASRCGSGRRSSGRASTRTLLPARRRVTPCRPARPSSAPPCIPTPARPVTRAGCLADPRLAVDDQNLAASRASADQQPASRSRSRLRPRRRPSRGSSGAAQTSSLRTSGRAATAWTTL